MNKLIETVGWAAVGFGVLTILWALGRIYVG